MYISNTNGKMEVKDIPAGYELFLFVLYRAITRDHCVVIIPVGSIPKKIDGYCDIKGAKASFTHVDFVGKNTKLNSELERIVFCRLNSDGSGIVQAGGSAMEFDAKGGGCFMGRYGIANTYYHPQISEK